MQYVYVIRKNITTGKWVVRVYTEGDNFELLPLDAQFGAAIECNSETEAEAVIEMLEPTYVIERAG